MSTLMRRRPMRECAEKLISYEEESSLPETVESSGSNSNSMDAKVLPPAPEVSRVPPTGDFELPPGGDKIAEALLMGFTHLDNYEPASCLQVDPACLKDDLPSFSKPGLDVPVEEILRTYSSCTSMNLEENLAPVRTFPSFYRSQADSCASSDCSDFLGFMEDGQAATKKRKKRRNLTGWPVEKPRRKLKDKEIGSSCLLLNNRALTPEPARLTSAAVTPLSASSPVRRRCGRPSKIRPCLSATLPIPSPLASDHPPSPASDYHSSSLPIKKKISRFGTRRSILK
uniref:Uncharacterized protein n=1 Tax=Lygus hesperus TaxID=30085 RepID=A0A0A9VY56_LYGHE